MHYVVHTRYMTFGHRCLGVTIWVLTVWAPDVSALCCFSAVSISLSYVVIVLHMN